MSNSIFRPYNWITGADLITNKELLRLRTNESTTKGTSTFYVFRTFSKQTHITNNMVHFQKLHIFKFINMLQWSMLSKPNMFVVSNFRCINSTTCGILAFMSKYYLLTYSERIQHNYLDLVFTRLNHYNIDCSRSYQCKFKL